MVDRYFAEYASYHTDRRNLICHEIGIPLIVWALFSLLELVKIGPIDLGMVVGVLIIAFYLRLDVRLALVALVAFAALYVAGRYTPWPVAVGAFVVGWIFQFVGHGYEGKKPAFLNNLVHLLVGPLWICSLAMPPRARRYQP
ncbi:MAG TPA: Mpo1-like protein [Candidatus Eremiobacteraceae bacterium]|nr:Mpo1-like protein [Candidatus Eremiobacteraceae bacterium]